MDKQKVIQNHLDEFNNPGFNVMKSIISPKFADPMQIYRYLEQGNTLPVISKQVILKMPLMDQIGACMGIFTPKSKSLFVNLFVDALTELEGMAKASAN